MADDKVRPARRHAPPFCGFFTTCNTHTLSPHACARDTRLSTRPTQAGSKANTLRRDTLVAIQTSAQARWAATRVFEEDAPEPGTCPLSRAPPSSRSGTLQQQTASRRLPASGWLGRSHAEQGLHVLSHRHSHPRTRVLPPQALLSMRPPSRLSSSPRSRIRT